MTTVRAGLDAGAAAVKAVRSYLQDNTLTPTKRELWFLKTLFRYVKEGYERFAPSWAPRLQALVWAGSGVVKVLVALLGYLKRRIIWSILQGAWHRARRLFNVYTVVGALLAVLLKRAATKLVASKASSIVSSRQLRPMQPKFIDEAIGEMRSIIPTSATKRGTKPHPEDDALYRGAASTAKRWAEVIGRELYEFQRSPKERIGSREIVWDKDTQDEHVPFDPPDNAVIALLDVDHYVEKLPQMMAKHVRPWVIYATMPERVAGRMGNASFTFDEQDRIVVHRTGGSVYRHRLWDWNREVVTVHIRKLKCWQTVTYKLCQRRLSEGRYLIAALPIGVWKGLAATVMSRNVQCTPLERLKVSVGRFLRMTVVTDKGVWKSTGVAGEFSCAHIPAAQDEAVAVASATGAGRLSIATVATYVDHDKALATRLVEFHRTHSRWAGPVVTMPGDAVIRYQIGVDNYDPDAKPGIRAYMSPLLREAHSPDQTYGNEKQAIKGRLLDVAPKVLRITPFLSKCMDEFVLLTFGKEKHTLVPWDEDEVRKRQKRPTQVQTIEEAVVAGDAEWTDVLSFLKKEGYDGAKDPRVITTQQAAIKVAYSKVCYAMSDLLKRLQGETWYMVGRTPLAIVERVAALCSVARRVLNTDMSRFDGHYSNLMRELERRALAYVFKPSEHEHVLRLHSGQYLQEGRTMHGFSYETGFSRMSGSPETSLFNSMATAFIAFVAQRYRSTETVAQCYAKIGVAYGDDGITPDIDAQRFDLVAGWVGQDAKAFEVKRGERGVEFLARRFGPGIWSGDTNSVCSIRRSLRGMHLSPSLPAGYDAKDKLAAKSYAYWLSDRNTPVIGQFVTAVMNKIGVKAFQERLEKDLILRRAVSFNATEWDPETQYPNEAADWFDAEAEKEVGDLDTSLLLDYLDTCEQVEDFLRCPEMGDPRVDTTKKDAVVGEVINPPDPVPPSDKERLDNSAPVAGTKRKTAGRDTRQRNQDRRRLRERGGRPRRGQYGPRRGSSPRRGGRGRARGTN